MAHCSAHGSYFQNLASNRFVRCEKKFFRFYRVRDPLRKHPPLQRCSGPVRSGPVWSGLVRYWSRLRDKIKNISIWGSKTSEITQFFVYGHDFAHRTTRLRLGTRKLPAATRICPRTPKNPRHFNNHDQIGRGLTRGGWRPSW